MLKAIGERLRLIRKMRSMTQVEAARRFGMTKEHVSVVERGGCYPSMDMLIKAAEIYETELYQFFLFPGNKEDPRPDSASRPEQNFAPGDRVVSGCGVWTMDLAAGRDVWSDDLRRSLGSPRLTKAAVQNFLRVVCREDAPKVKRFLDTVRARGRPRPLACTVVREDGIARRLFLQADQLEDESETPDLARIVVLDITDWAVFRDQLLRDRDRLEASIEERSAALRTSEQEARAELDRRVAAEQESRRNREHLERVLSAVPAILYSFAPSQGGTEWHSPHMQETLGISLEELREDPMLWHDSIHSEDLPMVDEAIRLAQQGHPINVEYRIKGRDGQWRWLHDRATPFRDETNGFCLAGVAVNVTERKRIEEALRESREMFQAVAEDIPALLCRYAPGCFITYVNEAYCRCFGKTRAELDGACFLKFMPQADQTLFLAGLAALTPENPTVQTEHQVFDLNGNNRWHCWTDRAIFDSRGRITAYQSIGEDVTERKAMMEKLHRSEEQFRTLFMECPVSIIIHDKDNGAIIDANPAACAAYGAVAVQDLRDHDIWLDPPYSFAQALSWIRTAATQGPQDLEWLNRKVTGELFWEHVRLALITIAGVERVMAVSIDVTKRREAEEDLRLKSLILDQITDHVTIVDLNGVITYVNQAQADALGLRVEDIVGRFTDVFGDDAQLRYTQREIFEKCLRDGAWRGEVCNAAGGGERIVDLRAQLIKNAEGRPAALFGIATDISKQRKIEAAEAASRVKSEFLANMSHEIRTPLGGIIGALQIVASQVLDAKLKNYLHLAMDAGDGLASLLTDMLAIADIEAGRHVKQEERFALDELCASVLQMFTAAARNKNIALHCFLDARLPGTVFGDAARTRHVLFNLVGNAVKFTKQGEAAVRVSVGQLEGQTIGRSDRETVLLRFTVSDTGIGIPHDRIVDIFEPFFQVNGSTTRQHLGAGLGLTVVKRLVDQMDGRVCVESAEGEGTSVHVVLPFTLPEEGDESALGQS